MKNFRWGIAGLGSIADSFASDIQLYSEYGTIRGAASRDISRSKEFCTRHNIPHCYSDYDQLALSPEIDGVYIAVIHPYHKLLTEKFLKAGKHVLVEKPAFPNLQDWLSMRSLAESENLLLLEGVTTGTFPAYRELKRIIQDNQLHITDIQASFGYDTPYSPDDWIYNPDLCGGATLDVGIYPLWLYMDITGFNPSCHPMPEVSTDQSRHNSGVDELASYHFSNPAAGRLTSAIAQTQSEEARLIGKNLQITLHSPWWNPSRITIHKGQHKITINEPFKGRGFQFEADHFASLVLAEQRDSPIMTHRLTESVLQVIEQGLHANGLEKLTLSR